MPQTLLEPILREVHFAVGSGSIIDDADGTDAGKDSCEFCHLNRQTNCKSRKLLGKLLRKSAEKLPIKTFKQALDKTTSVEKTTSANWQNSLDYFQVLRTLDVNT